MVLNGDANNNENNNNNNNNSNNNNNVNNTDNLNEETPQPKQSGDGLKHQSKKCNMYLYKVIYYFLNFIALLYEIIITILSSVGTIILY